MGILLEIEKQREKTIVDDYNTEYILTLTIQYNSVSNYTQNEISYALSDISMAYP